MREDLAACIRHHRVEPDDGVEAAQNATCPTALTWDRRLVGGSNPSQPVDNRPATPVASRGNAGVEPALSLSGATPAPAGLVQWPPRSELRRDIACRKRKLGSAQTRSHDTPGHHGLPRSITVSRGRPGPTSNSGPVHRVPAVGSWVSDGDRTRETDPQSAAIARWLRSPYVSSG